MRFYSYPFILAGFLILSACTFIHQPPIIQGNVLPLEKVALLKPGLTKQQVIDICGSPLLKDPFHSDRFDYVWHVTKKGKVLEEKRLVVIFQKDNKVKDIIKFIS